MTQEEAEKVLGVVANADGGCSKCVRSLIRQLNEVLPEWAWGRDEDTEELSVRLR